MLESGWTQNWGMVVGRAGGRVRDRARLRSGGGAGSRAGIPGGQRIRGLLLLPTQPQTSTLHCVSRPSLLTEPTADHSAKNVLEASDDLAMSLLDLSCMAFRGELQRGSRAGVSLAGGRGRVILLSPQR